VLDGVERCPFRAEHLEDPAHDGHPLRINHVIVAGGVVSEAVGAARARNNLPLACPAELAPARALRRLGPLVARELVEDAIGELALGRVISAVVEGLEPAPVLVELPL
jgi:hypothetical protein